MIRRARLTTALGHATTLYSLAFLGPLLVSLVLDQDAARIPIGGTGLAVKYTTLAFLLVFVFVLVLGMVLTHMGGRESDDLRPQEAIVAVGLGSLLAAVLGALPFILTRTVGTAWDGLFEGMSGITTTGSTVLVAPYSQYAESVLLWRSLLEWVGGLGIIVLAITVIGQLTLGTHPLVASQSPGGTVTRLRPKIRRTVGALSGLYAVGTAIAFLTYIPLIRYSALAPTWGQAAFDAAIHALSTISTGGFSSHARSIAVYDSGLMRTAVTLFMVASGVSFALWWAVIQNRSTRVATRNHEFRFYLGLFAAATLLVAAVFRLHGGRFLENLSHGAFQAASFLTGTGYTSLPTAALPDAVLLILLLLMFTGGMYGSTSGGLKTLRILFLFKLTRREMQKLLHPHAVSTVKFQGRILEPDLLHRAIVFFFAYAGLFIAGAAAHIALGADMLTGLSASASALGNVGPAFGSLHEGYAQLHPLSKMTHIVLMWLGRLEIFAALVILVPATYRDTGPG